MVVSKINTLFTEKPESQNQHKKGAVAEAQVAQVPEQKGKKLRPDKDIQNNTAKAAKGGSGNGKPSLFSVWSGDALSLFMFNVAPLVMQLNFKLRETLSSAQQAEAEAQIKAADASAALRVTQGQADAEKMHQESQSSLAGGISALGGVGQGLIENFGATYTMEAEQAMQNKMLSELTGGPKPTELEGTVAQGTIQDPAAVAAAPRAGREPLTAEQKDQIKADAQALQDQVEKRLEELKENKKGFFQRQRDKVGGFRWFGLNKSAELLEHEHELRLNQEAGKSIHEELLNGETGYKNSVELARKNPEAAAAFLEGLGTPEDALNTLRGVDSEVRGDILRQARKVSGESQRFALGLKQHLMSEREAVAARAAHERSILDAGFNKRQLLAQAITGMTSGATQAAQQNAIVDAAKADAEAQRYNAEASVMASVRGAQDGTIQSSLDQVKGLVEWYAQMESQVIGAVSQSMA